MNQPPIQHLQLPPLQPHPADAAPPNWDAVGRALGSLSQEVPRMAHVNVQAHLELILNGMNRLIDSTNAIHQRLDDVVRRIDMTPLRSFNAAAHSSVPLVYPAPFVAEPGGPLPFTKGELERITGGSAAIALGHLGQPIPQQAQARIEALQTYLGIMLHR